MGLARERLRELLGYDPKTGLFTRLVHRHKHRAGEIAGSINDQGYRKIGIDGKDYSAGRLAVFYVTGELPVYEVDHKDTDRSNDRWTNIRPATRAQNSQNTSVSRNNKVGLKGVTVHTPGPGNHRKVARYQATIRKNGKQTYLGSFDTPEDAHAAYSAAARETFGEFANNGV